MSIIESTHTINTSQNEDIVGYPAIQKCSICLDEKPNSLDSPDLVHWCEAECLHSYCIECINMWIDSGKNYCPTCNESYIPIKDSLYPIQFRNEDEYIRIVRSRCERLTDIRIEGMKRLLEEDDMPDLVGLDGSAISDSSDIVDPSDDLRYAVENHSIINGMDQFFTSRYELEHMMGRIINIDYSSIYQIYRHSSTDIDTPDSFQYVSYYQKVLQDPLENYSIWCDMVDMNESIEHFSIEELENEVRIHRYGDMDSFLSYEDSCLHELYGDLLNIRLIQLRGNFTNDTID
jgi:hypothetical protein